MNKTLGFFLALALLFAGVMTVIYAAGLFPSQREASSMAVSDQSAPPQAPLDGFEFTDQMGRRFHSDSLKGKVWVGSVFYSGCSSTCRVQNMAVAKLQQMYADRGVEFVSITCDPEVDTAAHLLEYGRQFNADADKWHLLTGDLELIKHVGNEMLKITVEKQTHSDRLVLIDREGQIRAAHRGTKVYEFEKLCEAIDQVLAESPEPDAQPTEAKLEETNQESS